MKILIYTLKSRSSFSCCNKSIYQASKKLNRYFSISGTHEQSDEQTKFSVSKYLQTKIKACGPITVAEYMKEALTNPAGGYYMNRDVFGKDGDFVTSPEISQLFGEMIGVWTLNEWRKVTKDDFQLVELGPGRGTLSSHILKTFKQFKSLDKLSLHLVEVSPTLSEIQAKKLCISSKEKILVVDKNDNNHSQTSHYKEGVTEDGTKVFWYYKVEDVPKNFSIFIAHEFFDALPIHKYQKTEKGWYEIFIDIVPEDEDKFRYVLSSFPTLTSKLFISNNETRDHVEVSPETLVTVDYLSQFIKEHGGIVLIVDYGHTGDKTDTFRAFKNHQQQDPLINTGSADLTADVDFKMLQKIATKADRTIVFGPVSQREFLLQLGIDVRLKMLLKNAKDNQKDQLNSEYNILIDNDKMGDCFKFMAIFPAVLKEHLTAWPVIGFYKEKSKKKDRIRPDKK